MGQGQPAELEVDRDKSTVEIMVETCKASVESFADLLTLERARGGVDGELGESRRKVDGAAVGGEMLGRCVLGEESDSLGSDEFDVGAESGGSQTVFDELVRVSVLYACTNFPNRNRCTFFCSMSLELGQS